MAVNEKTSKTKLPYKLEQILGFDLRSLAVFRIGLSFMVIADLLSRARSLKAHYTDAGVLPRTAIIDGILKPWYWSVHLISGQTFVQALLFILAFLMAFAMLVGYRTRLATIATWALNISLQNRNLALIFAGDDVLRAVLFWAMFLPLGACYSVDSALNSASEPLPKRVVSGATFAFIIQICYIYIWSAAYKTKSDIWWPDGDAVYYSLSFDQYATEIGHFLLGFPLPLLRIITFAALWFEWLGPLMLFIPWRTTFFRCLAIVSFILLHLGFELCFNIGVLSFLSIFIWLAFIPTPVWDSLAKRLSNQERRGLTIYYDAECGFCKKVVHLIRTFGILPGTPLLLAQDDDSIYADMQAYNSWVVVDWQGNRKFKFEALTYVFSLSPVLRILTPILKWRPMMAAGTKFYEMVASNRKVAGKFTKFMQFRPLKLSSSLPLNILAILLILLTSLGNFTSFVEQTIQRRKPQEDWISLSHKFLRRRTLQTVNIFGYLTRLDQSWSIFAPAPPADDGWYVIVGKLKDGTEVDLLRGTNSISWEKPTLKERHEIYRTIQWRVYYINLHRAIGQKLYSPFSKYLCQEWNAKHQGNQQLTSLEIYLMDERTVPPTEEQTVKKTLLWQQSCSN